MKSIFKAVLMTLGVMIIIVSSTLGQSPSKILFTRAPLGSADNTIYVMDGDGSNAQIGYEHPGDAQLMHWSDDLSKIIFSSDAYSTTGRHELFVMESDFTNVTQVTSFGDYWGQSSPRFVDENTILWGRPQIDEVCSINIDGTGYQALSNFHPYGKSVGDRKSVV